MHNKKSENFIVFFIIRSQFASIPPPKINSNNGVYESFMKMNAINLNRQYRLVINTKFQLFNFNVKVCMFLLQMKRGFHFLSDHKVSLLSPSSNLHHCKYYLCFSGGVSSPVRVKPIVVNWNESSEIGRSYFADFLFFISPVNYKLSNLECFSIFFSVFVLSFWLSLPTNFRETLKPLFVHHHFQIKTMNTECMSSMF